MRYEDLPTPKIGGKGHHLRMASAAAISQLEIAAAGYGGKHPAATDLSAFFAACAAAIVGSVSAVLAVPALFAARWSPSFSVTLTTTGSTSSYSTSWGWVRPTADVQYYWDPVNGADGNDGLTATTPKKNFSTLLLMAPTGNTIGIKFIGTAEALLLATGTGASGQATFNNVSTYTKNVVVTNDTGLRIIMCQVSSLTRPVYTLVSGTAGQAGAVYSTPSQTTSTCHSITDTITGLRTVPTNPATGAPLSNVPSRFRAYTLVASQAAVVAGTYWLDTTNSVLYVCPADGRDLTVAANAASLIVSNGGNIVRAGNQNNQTLSIENIDFVGGRPLFYYNASTVTGQVLQDYRCSYQGASMRSNYSGRSIQGFSTSYSYRCAAYDNGTDGFNYHSYEADGAATTPTSGTSPNFLEVECVAAGNGTTGSADVSSNATTSHDYTNGVRINCVYVNSDDRPLADVQYAYTWNIGTVIGPAVQQASGKENVAILDKAQAWLEGCTAVTTGSTNSPYISDGTAVINYRNTTPVPTTAGTGTVVAYT